MPTYDMSRSVDGGQCEGLRYAERADGTAPTPYLYICTNLIIKSFVGSEKGDILENIWARFS